MKFGIAVKPGLLLTAVSVLTSGLTGFYVYQASRNLLIESANSELLTATHVLASRIAANRAEISRNLPAGRNGFRFSSAKGVQTNPTPLWNRTYMATIQADGPSHMVKRPTGSGGEPSSPNCGASAGVRLVNLIFKVVCNQGLKSKLH